MIAIFCVALSALGKAAYGQSSTESEAKYSAFDSLKVAHPVRFNLEIDYNEGLPGPFHSKDVRMQILGSVGMWGCKTAAEERLRLVCSGVVGPSQKEIITSAHCLFDDGRPRIASNEVCVFSNKLGVRSNLDLAQPLRVPSVEWNLGRSGEGDVAVVQLSRPIEDVKLIPISDRLVESYTEFYLVSPWTDVSKFPNLEPGLTFVQNGKIASVATGYENQEMAFAVDAGNIDTTGGQSGSPAIIWDGSAFSIVGVHSYSTRSYMIGNVKGRGFAVLNRTVIDELYNLDYNDYRMAK